MEWIHLTINGHPVKVSFDENSIHVFDAFLIKDDLKQRGYRWNPLDKSWTISPLNVASEVDSLKNNLEAVQESIDVKPRSPDDSLPGSFSVGELRQKIDYLLNHTFQKIWVRGIIASEVKGYRWASYFDLRDEAEGSDLFFRSEIKTNYLDHIKRKLRETGVADDLEKDLPVFFQVEVSLSNRYSVDVRLSVTDILPEYTQSKLKNQRDLTLEKLRDEGILEWQKKLEVPLLINRIILITSELGTSIRDIQAGLHPHENRYEIGFFDTRMEGAQAVDQIIGTLEYIEKQKNSLGADVIVIARGGGSEQSLAVFNDYHLCKKICLMSVPVWTAIGHEKDLSAAEICSHLTPVPSTPSGMGKYLLNRFESIQSGLVQTVDSLIRHSDRILQVEMGKIWILIRNVPHRFLANLRGANDGFITMLSRMKQSAIYFLNDHRKGVSQSVQLLQTRIRISLSQRARLVGGMITRLDFIRLNQKNRNNISDIRVVFERILNQASRQSAATQRAVRSLRDNVAANQPEKILKKGFTMAFNDRNQIITSVTQFPKDASVQLKFWDGKIRIKRKEES